MVGAILVLPTVAQVRGIIIGSPAFAPSEVSHFGERCVIGRGVLDSRLPRVAQFDQSPLESNLLVYRQSFQFTHACFHCIPFSSGSVSSTSPQRSITILVVLNLNFALLLLSITAQLTCVNGVIHTRNKVVRFLIPPRRG